MNTTLNHLKKGESLENKQLVLINSNGRDKTEQGTSSFTYTFDQPIKRISKMDIIYTKIPKTFYNVNNDNATMSVTTETFTETRTDALVVDDDELQKGNILATNIIDGTVLKSNKLTCTGDIGITRIITKNSFIYVSGLFCTDVIDFRNFYDVTADNPLSNIGDCDLFIAKYSIEQELELRFRIGGIENDQTVDIYAVSDFLFISGNFSSFPLSFYNQNDAIEHSIASDGNPTGFLAKYTLSGDFEWVVKIVGVNRNITPIVVTASDNTNKVYVTGSFNLDLEFYNINNSIIPGDIISIPYTGTGDTHVFVAQYNYDGTLEWVSTMTSGSIARSIDMNTITDQVMVGVEFFDTLTFASEYVSPTFAHTPMSLPLELIGVQNLSIVEFKQDSTIDNRIRIGGSSFESGIQIDVNNNVLAVAGLYISNPLGFYDTNDAITGFLDVNGIVNNIFIAKYDLTSGKQFLWSINIYDETDAIEDLDVSATVTGEILLVGNYSSLLKFNDVDGQKIGQDLLNSTDNGYTFMVKYNSDGKFEQRSYIETAGVVTGSSVGISIDAHSNETYIAGKFNTESISLYNSDNVLHSSMDNLDTTVDKLNNGYIISYINNVNNYIIDTTTLNKRIICRALTGNDLNYVINLNSFSQQLGLSESTLLQAMSFGSPISWNSLEINETNNVLVIEFSIGNKTTELFEKLIVRFKITTFGTYRPYNLAFELNRVIKETLSNQNNFDFTQTDDVIKYNSIKKIFYLIFTINGTFRILPQNSQNLYATNGLNLPLTVSNHCVISDTTLEDEPPIEVSDNSKLTMKIAENIIETRFNNVEFDVAFPNISGGSGVLTVNGQLNQQLTLVSGSSDDNLSNDLNVKDTLEFDAPWLYADPNEVTFKNALQWRSVASNFDNSIITAVVNDGYIYVSDSGGSNWIQKEVTKKWRNIAMSRSGLYQTAVAENDQIYISSNFGVKWTPKESVRQWSDIALSRNTVSLLDGKYQTAVNRGGRIYVSHDFGDTWVARGGRKEWLSVAISGDGLKQVAVIFGGSVWFSIDAGLTWVESPGTTRDWQSVTMSEDASVTAAVTILDNVYYSSDAGATWGLGVLVANGKILTEISIAKTNPNVQSIVSDAGSIYYTNNGGITWSSNRTQESWSGITLSDDGIFQTAIVRGGGIYQSDTSGVDWTELKDSKPWLDIAMSSDGVFQIATKNSGGFISEDDGELWQSNNSGITWKKVDLGTTPSPRYYVLRQGGLAMSADGVYRYYTSISGVVRSDDSGATWSIIITGATTVRMGIAVSADGRHVTVGGYTGTVSVSNDFGLTYVSKGPSGAPRTVSMSSDGSFQMIVGGGGNGGVDGVIYTTTDYWDTWTQHITGIDSWFTGAMSLDGNVLIAVGVSTAVYMSIDRGATWFQNTQFTSSENINKFALSQDGTVIVALRVNSPIYVSNDKGVTFIDREFIRPYQSVALSLTGEKIGTVVNGGGIIQSNNFGDTWRIKRLIFSESYNSKPWVTTSMSRNGKFIVACASFDKMYLSKDYGKSFIQVEGDRQEWTSSAISDDGQKIVGLYTVIDNFKSGVQTSWDGGNTFYTTDPNGPISNLFAEDIAMSGDGSVVLFGGNPVIATPPDQNIFISINSTPPTGAYDTSWVYDTSASGQTNNMKFTGVDMNRSGTIRYACSGQKNPGPHSLNKLMKWVDSSESPHPSAPYYDAWYDTGYVGLDYFNAIPRLVSCSDDGSQVTIGEPLNRLRNSTDYGNNFSAFIGPTFGLFISKLKMSGDGLVQALVSKEILYVTYDSWSTYHEHGVVREWRSLGMSDDGQRMIVGVQPGWLYQSFDKGETFGVQQTRRQPLNAVLNDLGDRQIVASAGRELYTSTTFGNIWSSDGPANSWADLALAKSADSAIAVPSYGLLYVNDYVGSGWIVGGPTPQTTKRRWVACAVSYDGMYRLAAEENGILYISTGLSINSAWTDSGAGVRNWQSCTINGDGNLMAAVDFGGYIYISTDNGGTWVQRMTDMARNWKSIAASFGNDILIAAEINGSLYHSENTGGAVWTEIPDKPRQWQSVAVSKFGEHYTAVALGDFIYVANLNLIFEPKESNKNWVSVDMNVDGDVQVAVSFNDEVYKSVDFGNTWDIQIGIKEITSVSMSTDGIFQAVVEQGGQIYISSDSGITWTPKEKVRAWRSIDVGFFGNTMLATAYDDTVYFSSDYGVTWVAETLPQPKNNFVSIYANNDSTVILAAPVRGSLVRKLNGTWANVGPGILDWIDVSINFNGNLQYAVARNSPIYKSTDYGTTWTILTSSPSLLWSAIDSSKTGEIVTAVASGGQIYVSYNYGAGWVPRDVTRNWNGVSLSFSGIFQIACVNDGQIYASVDSGLTWVPKERNRQWRDVEIDSEGLIQIAADINRVYFHQFRMDKRILFTIEAIDSDVSLIDTAFTLETATAELLTLHNFDLSLAQNFTMTRTNKIPAQDIFIPPGNYTPETLVSTINGLIMNIDPTWTNPPYGFTYNPTNGKISFTSKISGPDIIVSTNLLEQMGFTDVPAIITAGVPNIANNSINPDISGPLNIFIKSNIIGDLRKNKTAFSTNKNLENLIAPLELNILKSTYEVPFPIEIFLSKKTTINMIDIQIVDENGNIVNLNGGSIQVNFYFYSS